MDYLNYVIAFLGDVSLQPNWVQVWFVWMVTIIIVAPFPLLHGSVTRRDGQVAAASALFLALVMPFWHAEVGYTRLLGLPHFVAWVPLLAWLYWRRAHLIASPRVRWAVLILAATTATSLAFDGTDVIRYALGERALLGGAVG